MPSSTIWRNPGCFFIQNGTTTKWSDLEFAIFFKNIEIQSSEVPSSTIWRNPGCFFIQYGRLKTILCRPWPLPLCKVYFIEDILDYYHMDYWWTIYDEANFVHIWFKYNSYYSSWYDFDPQNANQAIQGTGALNSMAQIGKSRSLWTTRFPRSTQSTNHEKTDELINFTSFGWFLKWGIPKMAGL